MATEHDGPKPMIVPLPNGPYYLLNDQEVTPVDNLRNSLGQQPTSVRGVALCRCGGSQNKPFCDGTHGTNGFTDTKTSDGSLNKRDNYVGRELTIHDNRGICAHAGECTSNLATVFKLGTEPWIDPDGATADAIIQTIRRCPSGALSYSVKNVEHRDHDRDTLVMVSKDGPYQVTGGIGLPGVERGEGASEEHYTLCRCGGSGNKPFCDGTHWHIKFKDEKN